MTRRAAAAGGVLLLTVVMCACAGGTGAVAGVTPTSSGCPCLDREFSLKVGSPVTIQGEQLDIHLESVGPDSRCPAEITCVWEGDALATIALTQQGQAPGRLLLHTSKQFAGEPTYLKYRVRLTNLTPLPRAEGEIAPESYTATLLVSR